MEYGYKFVYSLYSINKQGVYKAFEIDLQQWIKKNEAKIFVKYSVSITIV